MAIGVPPEKHEVLLEIARLLYGESPLIALIGCNGQKLVVGRDTYRWVIEITHEFENEESHINPETHILY